MYHALKSSLTTVLPLAPEMCRDPVQFEPHGKARVQAVIQSATGLKPRGILRKTRNLRKDVRAANQGMHPRLKPRTAPRDFWAGAVLDVFYVLVQINGWSKCRDDAPFKPKPLVCEVRKRGARPNGTGKISGGTEADKRQTERELKAKVVTPAKDESWIWRRGSSFGFAPGQC